MNKLTQEEEEYLEELKLCLEEDGEITPPARRLLNKIRDKAGITPERVLQLEKMMGPSEETPPITDEEAEYIQEFRACIEEDGEITTSSRRLLDRLAKKSGIDESRAKELKAMVTSEVSATDEGSNHNPDSAHLPAEQFHHTTDILKHIEVLLPDLRLHSPDDLTYCYIPEEIPERQFINFNKHAADRIDEGEILLIYYDEALFDRLSRDNPETERKPLVSEISAKSQEKTEVLKGKFSADGEVDPSESTELYNQFLELSCSRETRLEIMEALSTATPIESYFPQLKENIALLTEKERRNIIYALYFNLVSMAKVDGYMLDDAERAMLASYCREFGISDEEADNIDTIAENTIKLVRGEITEDAFKKATKNSIATASGLGVPVAALFFMGTVGFSGAGIMSGLAPIGGVLAFIPGLNAATLGIVGLVGIGTFTYKGIQYATGIKEREQKKKREMLLQKAMENHQKSISTLQSDMNHLSERLQSASKDTHQNAALIEKLNRQMALFKQTMMESRKRGEKIKLESEALSAS